jgi:hypothetical protein
MSCNNRQFLRLVALSASLSLFLVGCKPQPSAVCFMLKEDFQGWFCVTRGTGSDHNPILENNTIIYDLRASTTLRVTDTKPLEMYNTLFAKYPSGKIIYSFTNNASESPRSELGSEYILRGLFATSGERFYYYLGPLEGLGNAHDAARADVAAALRTGRD